MGVGAHRDVGLDVDRELSTICILLDAGRDIPYITKRLNMMRLANGGFYTEQDVYDMIREYDLFVVAPKPSFEVNGKTVEINPREE